VAIDPSILTRFRVSDVGGAIGRGLVNAQRIQQIGQEREQAPFRNQILEQQAESGAENNRISSLATFAQEIQPDLASGNIESLRAKFAARQQQLANDGIQGNDTLEGLSMLEAGDFQGLSAIAQNAIGIAQSRGLLKAPAGSAIGTGQREFESKLSGLTEDQKLEATLIDLGIKPRAISSADVFIAKENLTDLVADSKAVIKQRGKFAEMTGSSLIGGV